MRNLIPIDYEEMLLARKLYAWAGTAYPLSPAGWGPSTQNLKTANQNMDTSGTARTYRTWHPVIRDCNMVRLVYANHASPGSENTHPITIGSRVEFQPNGANMNDIQPMPVYFNGNTTTTIEPGRWVISDPFFGPFLASGNLWIRSYVSGQSYPLTGHGPIYGREGVLDGNQLDAPNYATAFLHDSAVSYLPSLILSPTGGMPTVSVFGDSIGDNAGETAFPSVGGFIGRALNSRFGYNRVCSPGRALATALDEMPVFGLFLSGTTNVICEYGTNDNGQGYPVETTMANMLKAWSIFARNGQRVFQTTILPKTSSTDSWATTTNQTAEVGEAARLTENSWLRAGALIKNGAPVAVGTSDAIVAGQAAHPLHAVIDTAAAVEVNIDNKLTTNGGYWMVNGTANFPTVDGTHPADSMAALMAVPVTTAPFI